MRPSCNEWQIHATKLVSYCVFLRFKVHAKILKRGPSLRNKSVQRHQGYLFHDEDKEERKKIYGLLSKMSIAQHDVAIGAIESQRDVVREIAAKSGFRGFEDQVHYCAIEARAMQKDWWGRYGTFINNFGTSSAARACADRLRKIRSQLNNLGIANRLRLEAMRSGSTELSMIDNDIMALERIASMLDHTAKSPMRLGKARYDLRLMSKAPRALWAIKHGRLRIDRFEKILRGSDNSETIFIYNILRFVDPTVAVETIKNIDQGLGELLDFGDKDWKEFYMPRFEMLMPIFNRR